VTRWTLDCTFGPLIFYTVLQYSKQLVSNVSKELMDVCVDISVNLVVHNGMGVWMNIFATNTSNQIDIPIFILNNDLRNYIMAAISTCTQKTDYIQFSERSRSKTHSRHYCETALYCLKFLLENCWRTKTSADNIFYWGMRYKNMGSIELLA